MSQEEKDFNIANRLPYTWQAFFERFRGLTEVQRLAIPKILEGKNLILCSPTASGKTEAVCAPLVEKYFKKRKWLILYICPTRALTNDLYERLTYPLSVLGIGISRHTGDHHDNSENTRVLLTTPESFDSILCRGKITCKNKDVIDHRLSNVTAIVLDEIHCIYGTPRGEQLIWLIERLKRLRSYAKNKEWADDDSLQIVALSATIASVESLKERYLPLNDSECLIIKGSRDIETVSVDCELPTTELALKKYIIESDSNEKILVFSNTRKRVDNLAKDLKQFLAKHGYKVFAHHGSLSKKLREQAELAMKEEQKIVLFSSPTLEIGIDIGDIDLVVLDSPAADIQTLLQRIGRGNRRTNITRVMCCAGNLAEVIIHSAMIEAARQGLLFGNLSGPYYAVAIQQIASYIYQSKDLKRGREHLSQFLELKLSKEYAKELLQHLINNREFRHVEDKLTLGESWVERTANAMIHSNIESIYGLHVNNPDDGINIAQGINYYGGNILNIGGKLLKIKKWEDRRLEVIEIKNNDVSPDANWGYYSKAWLKGTGQQEALRYYCKIPVETFPEIISGNNRYYFHFGGAIRAIVLRLIFEVHFNAYKINRDDVNEWYIKTGNDIKTTWQKTKINTSLLKIKAQDYLETLEKKLNRPYANKALPLNLRLDEIYQWLRLEEEVHIIQNSKIEEIKDDDIKNILKIIIKQYERRSTKRS